MFSKTPQWMLVLLGPLLAPMSLNVGALLTVKGDSISVLLALVPLVLLLLLFLFVFRAIRVGITPDVKHSRGRLPYHLDAVIVARKLPEAEAESSPPSALSRWCERVLKSSFGTMFLAGKHTWEVDPAYMKHLEREHRKSSGSRKKPSTTAPSLLTSFAKFFTALNGPVRRPPIISASHLDASAEGPSDDPEKAAPTLRESLQPLFIIFECVGSMLIGIMTGLSLGNDNERTLCEAALVISIVVNGFLVLLLIAVQPFVIPFRNACVGLIDTATLASSIIAFVVSRIARDAEEKRGGSTYVAEQSKLVTAA